MIVKLRLETRGRGGKMVTVLDGLPRNTDFLESLGKELKKLLGTGGTIGETLIELQGDHRDSLRRILSERNFLVKG